MKLLWSYCYENCCVMNTSLSVQAGLMRPAWQGGNWILTDNNWPGITLGQWAGWGLSNQGVAGLEQWAEGWHGSWVLGEEDVNRVKPHRDGQWGVVSVFIEGEEHKSQVWIQEKGAWRVVFQVHKEVSYWIYEDPRGELMGWSESHALETFFVTLGAFFHLERKSVTNCLWDTESWEFSCCGYTVMSPQHGQWVFSNQSSHLKVKDWKTWAEKCRIKKKCD